MLKNSNLNFCTEFFISDSSSESSHSAPSLSSSISETQTPLTTQPRNVNTLTPSKKPKSHIIETLLQPLVKPLVKHEDVLPTQKKDFHPILVDYGDDQFTLRILDRSNTITYTPLKSFCFKSVSSVLSKNKNPIMNNCKTLLQENHRLNETVEFSSFRIQSF